MRRERGQWYGPARVALVENKRIVWLVHESSVLEGMEGSER